MRDINQIPVAEMELNRRIKLEVCETEFDLYWKVALEVFDLIYENNKQGKPSVMIVPFGPVGPYRRLSWLVNTYRLSLKYCTFINMDEYLDDEDNYIDMNHPLSFRGGMNREFYSQIDVDLNLPEQQRIFPEPGQEEKIWEIIEKNGGLDLCLGGVGINGHVAFNEPPEPGVIMTNEAFKALPTRILHLARETRTINAVMNCRGDLEGVPAKCITVGMKEIWQAKRVRLCLPREWNAGALYKVLYESATCKVPCSLFQEHPDAKLYAASIALQSPTPAIRLYNNSELASVS